MSRSDKVRGSFTDFRTKRRSFLRISRERCFRVSACILLLAFVGQNGRAAMTGADVMATVEGSPITRRELTYYWLRVDAQLPGTLLGTPLVDAWVAAPGRRTYTLTEAQIYARFYGPLAMPKLGALGALGADPDVERQARRDAKIANVLSSLVTNRLVATMVKRAGIQITHAQIRARAHATWDGVRHDRNVSYSDEKLMRLLKVPEDIFMQDMAFRLRTEALIRLEIERRNGHPIGASDWAQVRELYSTVELTGHAAFDEAKFEVGRRAIAGWLHEIDAGAKFEDEASKHNGDSTRDYGGLRGPVLLGTGTPALEAAIRKLKPGETSPPTRAPNGWYVFRLVRNGAAISTAERDKAWKEIVDNRTPFLLAALRKSAHITSKIPLPPVEPPKVEVGGG